MRRAHHIGDCKFCIFRRGFPIMNEALIHVLSRLQNDMAPVEICLVNYACCPPINPSSVVCILQHSTILGGLVSLLWPPPTSL
jgi:hypothetical protein